MRHSESFPWIALLALSAAACSQSPASPSEPGVPSLAIRTDQNNVREPFSIIADNPCTAPIEAH